MKTGVRMVQEEKGEKEKKLVQGKITRKLGEELVEYYGNGEFKVFYDHGDYHDNHVCEPRLYFTRDKGKDYFLAVVDIAILSSDGSKVEVICELEERGATPKKIIGDMIDIFLADKIKIKKHNSKYKDGLDIKDCSFILGIVETSKRADELKKRARDIKNRIQSITGECGVQIEEPIFKSKGDELQKAIREKIIKRCPKSGEGVVGRGK